MEIITILLRFLLVFALSFAFGIERQRAHKPIGFGTYIFVAVGACALAIIAITFSADNPLGLLGAIVSGIGFLGAGALIKTSDRVFGFTAAASIWAFAIIGLAIGIGHYLTAVSLYSTIWLVVLYDRFLEKRGIGSYQKKITITTNKILHKDNIESILIIFTGSYKLMNFEANKKNNTMTMLYLIEGTREELNRIPKALSEQEWFESFKLE